MILKNIYIYLFLPLLLFFKNEAYGKTVINVVGSAENDQDTLYITMINDFNQYAEENNLDIYLNLKVVKSSSDNFEAYGSMVEQLLKKKSNKYDLYYFDNAYTQKYGQYLYNLRKLLPKEHIDMYHQNLLSYTCKYEDKLVGLPFTIAYSLLYSNKALLSKYNKPIPQTWDELIETSLYIKEQENDPNLIAYNGFFDESDNGLCSVYEFIHSCRDKPEDPFPEIRSNTTVQALELLKRLKKEIGSDEVFKQGFEYNLGLLIGGQAIFVKFWTLTYSYLNMIPYTPSILPGMKKGVSGATTAGYNLGIDGSISPEKLEAAKTAYIYLTSKEFQKKYFLGQLLQNQ